MKINIFLSLSLLFLIACGKNDEIDLLNGSDNSLGTFSAKIDGQSFEASTVATAVLSVIDTSFFDFTLFQLNGADVFANGTFKNLIVTFGAQDLSLNADTYTTDGECASQTICPVLIYHQQGTSEDDPNNFAAVSNSEGGSLSVTFAELNLQAGGKAVGTFFGTIYDEFDKTYHQITEGKFNLIIQ